MNNELSSKIGAFKQMGMSAGRTKGNMDMNQLWVITVGFPSDILTIPAATKGQIYIRIVTFELLNGHVTGTPHPLSLGLNVCRRKREENPEKLSDWRESFSTGVH